MTADIAQGQNLTQSGSPAPYASVYTGQPVQPGVGAPLPSQPPPAPMPTVPKERPNIFLFVGIGMLVLALIGFLVWFFFFRGRGQVELTYWGLWEDESVIGPLISEYQSQNPNVKITYQKQSKEDYRERLTNSLAQDKGPDLFRFHNTWVPMLKNELDSLPGSVMSAAEFSEAFYPIFASDLTSGTTLVGIPLEYDGLVLFINDEIISATGKTPPSTWDELRVVARELTTIDERGVITQAGVALGRTENVDHWPEILALMMLQNGVDLTNPTGNLAEDALTFFTVFSTVDGVWDRTLPASTVAFSGGKVAMMFGPSWRAFEIRAMNPTLKFRAVPAPQLPKDTPSDPSIAYASYWVEGVWTRSKKKLAAWDFLKFVASRGSLEKMYTNAAAVRGFGEPYPRVEMASLVSADPIVGAVISQAPYAESWYLQSRTFDGDTGINSQMNRYFEDAVNSVISGNSAKKALETASEGVNQVLSQYGLVTRTVSQ